MQDEMFESMNLCERGSQSVHDFEPMATSLSIRNRRDAVENELEQTFASIRTSRAFAHKKSHHLLIFKGILTTLYVCVLVLLGVSLACKQNEKLQLVLVCAAFILSACGLVVHSVKHFCNVSEYACLEVCTLRCLNYIYNTTKRHLLQQDLALTELNEISQVLQANLLVAEQI
jgi:hypothetical protein